MSSSKSYLRIYAAKTMNVKIRNFFFLFFLQILLEINYKVRILWFTNGIQKLVKGKKFNVLLFLGLEKAILEVPHKVHDVVSETWRAQDHQRWIWAGPKLFYGWLNINFVVWQRAIFRKIREILRLWIFGGGMYTWIEIKCASRIGQLSSTRLLLKCPRGGGAANFLITIFV